MNFARVANESRARNSHLEFALLSLTYDARGDAILSARYIDQAGSRSSSNELH